jgi:hypothetical protein
MSGGDVRGSTIFRWEPPDTCFLVLVGDVSGEDMRRLIAAALAQTASMTYTFGLIDMSRLGAVAPEARLVAKNEATAIPMRGTAVFGASFHHRVIATLINKAGSILKKDHQPIAFFATEAEARAWLTERREALLTKEREARRTP